MFDIKLIREDVEQVKKGLLAKNTDLDHYDFMYKP